MSKYQHYDDTDDEIMDQPEDEAQYEVGYMKPPTATQFKPGQSGNPSGRPKKQKSQQEIVQDALMGTVYVTENGQRKLRTRHEVIVQQQVNKAMRGDNKAAAQIMARADRIEHKAKTTGKIAEIKWIIVDHTSATPTENSA